MLRRYGEHESSIVTHAPDAEEIRRIEQRIPGTEIELYVHEGLRFADLIHRDGYSYELAAIFLGANSEDELLDKYRDCVQSMDIRFDDAEWRVPEPNRAALG